MDSCEFGRDYVRVEDKTYKKSNLKPWPFWSTLKLCMGNNVLWSSWLLLCSRLESSDLPLFALWLWTW